MLIVDRDPDRAKHAASALGAASFVGDVTDSAQVDDMMSRNGLTNNSAANGAAAAPRDE